ncbi:GspH/FimT family pseudopilin [Motiliproteus sp.]|uniref:GspH/FimT family pseudopilin n=1 Tax=Motiliproteus sp. TaxID=1898955 RepID=UPI003BAA622F
MSRTLVSRHPRVPLLFLQAGITLPEVVMTLAIVGILSTAGVSSFEQLVVQSKVDELSERMRTALAMARSEAITRGQRAVLCRLNDSGDGCAGTVSNEKLSWRRGWMLFIDLNLDRQFTVSDGDQLLRVFAPISPQLELRWNRGDYVSYQGSGALGSLNGTFCVGHRDHLDNYQQELILPYTGRLRTASVVCRYDLFADP